MILPWLRLLYAVSGWHYDQSVCPHVLMLRRAPSAGWLTPQMQEELKKIENCLECGQCMKKCPYELNTPELLKKNYEDYKKFLPEKYL